MINYGHCQQFSAHCANCLKPKATEIAPGIDAGWLFDEITMRPRTSSGFALSDVDACNVCDTIIFPKRASCYDLQNGMGVFLVVRCVCGAFMFQAIGVKIEEKRAAVPGYFCGREQRPLEAPSALEIVKHAEKEEWALGYVLRRNKPLYCEECDEFSIDCEC